MSVIPPLATRVGSSFPSVERTPEVSDDRMEGAQRAGMVVVEPATVVVELETTVEVGTAAVAVDVAV
jgi:hypothetical protein